MTKTPTLPPILGAAGNESPARTVPVTGTAGPVATAPSMAPAPTRGASGETRAIIEEDGTITLPLEVIATGLGAPADALWTNLGAGLVYQTVEKGMAEDAGRFRITFRFRSRHYRVIVDAAGQIVPAG